jgi:hypothetical protein
MKKIKLKEVLSDIEKNKPEEWAEFKKWIEKAEKARDKVFDILKDAKEKDLSEIDFKLDAGIWSELKKWMLKNITYNKCAYCEKILTTDEKETIYYDAEHYRPKAKVSMKGSSKDVQTTDEFGNKITHPGYFWIAYDYNNLLPSCKICNSGTGKQNQHPVKKTYTIIRNVKDIDKTKLAGRCIESPRRKDYYFLSVEELNKDEEPLLLNPFIDEVSESLRFDDGGIILPKDNIGKGENTIAILHLDREDLMNGRNAAQAFLQNFIDDYHLARSYPNYLEKRKDALTEIKKLTLDGIGEHSAYTTFYINENFTNIFQMLQKL